MSGVPSIVSENGCQLYAFPGVRIGVDRQVPDIDRDMDDGFRTIGPLRIFLRHLVANSSDRSFPFMGVQHFFHLQEPGFHLQSAAVSCE